MSTGYELPRCSQTRSDGLSCQYEPKYKCSRCQNLICIEHAQEFRTPNAGWQQQYDGFYCPSCFQAVLQEHDQRAEAANVKMKREKNVQSACDFTKCACDCTDSFCKSVV